MQNTNRNAVLIEELEGRLTEYLAYLEQGERCENTRSQYKRDILAFLSWGKDMEAVKETVIRYKEKLRGEYMATSVNAKLAAINGFFVFLDRIDMRVKQLRIQRDAYCSEDQELTREEYVRLVRTAMAQGKVRLALILQAICSTGIRVSELPFITVEAVKRGQAVVCLKGKNRKVLIDGKLRKLLRFYMHDEHIETGPVFITKSGKPMDRSEIWKQMKALCEEADVNPDKVYPHNLRHLFARCYYAAEKDIAKLADILGHSNINTTRIYIVSTGEEHMEQMERLGLVLG